MQNQMQEVLEDLETERESRNKAEKQKRDLNEVGIRSYKGAAFSTYSVGLSAYCFGQFGWGNSIALWT